MDLYSMFPGISQLDVFNAVMQDGPILIADIDTRKVLFTTSPIDAIFGTTMTNGLLEKDIAEVLPGWPADYSNSPRKMGFLIQRTAANVGLVAGLYPRIFPGRPQRMVLVVITEVVLRVAVKGDSVNLPKGVNP